MNILDKDYKMKVTPEQSRAVQEACFARDIEWHGGAAKAVAYTDKPYLYIHRWEGITFGNEGEEEFLKAEEFCLIEPESFIAMLKGEPKGHQHAELMAQYAQDAAETKTPWERWEWCADEDDSDNWEPCRQSPAWSVNAKYRHKPDTIKIGRHEFPRPMQTAPTDGTLYWYVNQYSYGFKSDSMVWTSHNIDSNHLNAGMCHSTREAAEQHAAVLNAINRGDVE